MSPFRPNADFTIISLDEARRVTGLGSAELREFARVQQLTRVFADGRKEPALRLPTELLSALTSPA
jgi:hypothetical protein